MFSTLTWHEFIIGIAAMACLAGVFVLLGFNHAIPTELWATMTSLFGTLIGIQIPKPTQP